MTSKNYFVYIMTNRHKKVLYTGVTNNLERRVYEHENELHDGFSKKYHCNFLVFYEPHLDIYSAISREKQIKSWRREKKNDLIENFNPQWAFLNNKILTI